MKIFNKKGFTLIETLIVVAIMGILSAIAAPTLQTYMRERRLNGAARQLYGDLTATRAQAVSMNRWVSLKIDTNHGYTLFRDANINGAVDSGETIATKDLNPDYHDVRFSTSAGTVIAFYPNGTGSTGTLTLVGPTGSKRITISSAGRIKIN